MPQSQLWAIVGLVAVALTLSRYRCLIHPRLLRFEQTHWSCPAGHECRVARDLDRDALVRLDTDVAGLVARPIRSDP